jgi:hypothetical protein
LLRNAQALGVATPRESLSGGVRLMAALLCVLPLAGCASGLDVGKSGVDNAMHTNTVASPAPDETKLSDSATIKNAVSAADIEALKGEPLAWANTETGSRGTISSVSESRAAGVLCRTFTASRESYDGVGLYQGEACLGDRGAWRMREFKPL